MDMILPQQQQSLQLSMSDRPFFSPLKKSTKGLSPISSLPPLSPSSPVSLSTTSTTNDCSQRRPSWKISLSRKLTKLRPKPKQQSQELEHEKPSFSYTIRDDNLTQFGQPRTQVFQELPPLHFNHFLNSKETSPTESPLLSPADTTSDTTTPPKDQSLNHVDKLVHLLCVDDATLSPTFLKYNSVFDENNENAPVENKNLELNELTATRPRLCVIQNTFSSRTPEPRPRSVFELHEPPLTVTHNVSNENRATAAKPHFCDIHKIQPNCNNGSSKVSPPGLYRRASDGFSKRRVLSFHDDLLQRNQHHQNSQQHQQQQQQHPWAPNESRSASPASDVTAVSANSSRSASSSASSLNSWSSAGSSATMAERHPEALRSDWKNLRLSTANFPGRCDVNKCENSKEFHAADVNAIYALANEIGCHRMREHRTVMQLRQMRARNRARWEFESLPRVHIALPLPPSGSPGKYSGFHSGRSDVRRNNFLYAYSYAPEEAESGVTTTGVPASTGTTSTSGSISRSIDARLSRVNSRIRNKVISHQVHFPAAAALPPSLTDSGSNSAATSSLGEPSVMCQTRAARFKLMRASSAAYLNRTVQGCGTVLPKGQFMAKMILLNRKHPVSMHPGGHVLRDVDGVQKQSHFNPQQQQQQQQQLQPHQHNQQLMMRGVSRMNGKATVSTAPPQPRISGLAMGSGIGGGARKVPTQWNLSTDVLTVMPAHTALPLRRLTTPQARRRVSGLGNVISSAGVTSPRNSGSSTSRVFRPTRLRSKPVGSVRPASCVVSRGSSIMSHASTSSGQKPRHPLRQFMVPEIVA